MVEFWETLGEVSVRMNCDGGNPYAAGGATGPTEAAIDGKRLG